MNSIFSFFASYGVPALFVVLTALHVCYLLVTFIRFMLGNADLDLEKAIFLAISLVFFVSFGFVSFGAMMCTILLEMLLIIAVFILAFIVTVIVSAVQEVIASIEDKKATAYWNRWYEENFDGPYYKGDDVHLQWKHNK